MHDVNGRVTRRVHVDVSEGTVEEEEDARRGFFGRTSHPSRSAPPVKWGRLEGDCGPRRAVAVA